jgi:2-C-methyl-D-erythritol 2,4-cyclodiphosphate synthase
MRVGVGFDAHRLHVGRRLVLGGVDIPHECGLVGHSDGDVAVHAIIDALLGAAALEDIGSHFPSTDPQYAGVSSLVLLASVRNTLADHGWRATNLDATIVAERPRLEPHIEEMRNRVSAALGLETGQVSMKATTTDGLGFTGKEEGMAAHAVAAIERI